MDYDSGILCDDCFNGSTLFYLIPQMALYYSLLLVATTLRAAMAKFKSDLSQMVAGIISVLWFCSFIAMFHTNQVQHIISKLQLNGSSALFFGTSSNFSWTIY
jgi:hypothetical protein